MPADAEYKVIKTEKVGGAGGFDYVTADPDGRKLYIPRAAAGDAKARVTVFDLDTLKPAGEIPDTKGVHGIAIASDLGRGFTSNGREDKVSMFDVSTLQLIRKISVGKGPDGMAWVASRK